MAGQRRLPSAKVAAPLEHGAHGPDSGAASRSTSPSGRGGRTTLGIERLNRSKPGAISLSMTSPCARLSGGREQQSVMLTTLLVIVACVAAGMIVHHTEHGQRGLVTASWALRALISASRVQKKAYSREQRVPRRTARSEAHMVVEPLILQPPPRPMSLHCRRRGGRRSNPRFASLRPDDIVRRSTSGDWRNG
jgi:hypothetical protein